MEQQILTRKELYDLVWAVPMLTLSRKYNISDVGLRKMCIRLNIPVPKTGYWQKIQFGKKVAKQRLVADNNVDQKVTLTLRDENSIQITGEVSPVKMLQKEIEDSIQSLLTVPDRLTNPDKLVVATKDRLMGQKPDSWKYIGLVNSSRSELNTRVSIKNISRALRFWDTLIKSLRARGHDVKLQYSETYAVVETHDFKLQLRERFSREIYKDGNRDGIRYQPSGILSLHFDSYPYKEWKDSKVALEEQLSKIIAYMELAGAKEKADQLIREKREEERKEQERTQQELLQRQKEDLSAFKEMLLKASRWHEATNLRNYIIEVETRALQTNNSNERLEEWLAWAKKKADWYDPFIEMEDDLLNTIDRDILEVDTKKTSLVYDYFNNDKRQPAWHPSKKYF